ncbi:MAG TPA: TIR domain-containing protein [Thermoanaerobaculia bacterium]|nr:TIR domain-containing protein [Thermoanaerobaculia bacterium]
MNFDSDIFISYAHIDNQPLTAGDEGWITLLHRALEVRLAQLLGEEPRIWRDPKIQGNDYFDTAILDKLPKTALLISVISPRYLKSDWCQKELEEFNHLSERHEVVEAGNKARLFKVVKTPVPLDRHPEPLQRLLGYDFFRVDPDTGRPIEFKPAGGTDEARKYWARLDDLAYDIYQLLEKIKSPEAGGGTGAAPSGATVYLAETSVDLTGERDAIRRELQERNYHLVPEQRLPLTAEELRSAIAADLARSVLSIHLIGSRYGVVPEGAETSIIDLQNSLAAERSREAGLRRMIWIRPDSVSEEPRQKAFLEHLRADPAAQLGAELYQTSIEDFNAALRKRLESLAKKDPAVPDDAPETADGVVRIYLICDREDYEAAKILDDFLYGQGFEVILPLFEGDEVAVREDHQENLCLCDAAIIYCGTASEVWLRGKLRDFLKAPGFGRKRPMLARAVYLGEPARPDKERFRTREAMVVQGIGGFSEEALQPFIEELKRKPEGG